MWLSPSGWNKTSWQHNFFMRLLCANRFFIWVNTICKWGFFFLVLEETISFVESNYRLLEKSMGGFLQHRKVAKCIH
jgi:hypothetical protein